MPKRKEYPAFIVELPLLLTKKQKKYLNSCLRAEHQLLIKLFKKMTGRYSEMKQTNEWKQATTFYYKMHRLEELPKEKDDKQTQQKIADFKKAGRDLYSSINRENKFYEPKKNNRI